MEKTERNTIKFFEVQIVKNDEEDFDEKYEIKF